MPEATMESSGASAALTMLAAATDSSPVELLESSVSIAPSSIDPSVKLACRLLVEAGLRAERLTSESGLDPAMLNAVGAGYAIGRLRLGGVPPPSAADARQDRAGELLDQQRRYDPRQLEMAMGPAVRAIQTELASRSAATVSTKAQQALVRGLTFIAFAAGFGLAAAEADLARGEGHLEPATASEVDDE